MASQKKPGETGDSPSEKSQTQGQGQGQAQGQAANPEDVLRPFQDASNKFLQAHLAAHETAIKQQAHTWLDLQDKVRQIEQDTYNAVMEATRKHVSRLGQQSGAFDEMMATRAQAQAEYEKDVRQAYTDAQSKLKDLAEKTANEQQGNDPVKTFTNQRQDAYQAYLADLQQAWSSARNLDPLTVNAIASSILSTIGVSQ